MNNLDSSSVSSFQPCCLLLSQASTNLDNSIPSSLVHLGMLSLEKVQDILGQGSVSGSDFIDDEVLVGKVFEKILRD